MIKFRYNKFRKYFIISQSINGFVNVKFNFIQIVNYLGKIANLSFKKKEQKLPQPVLAQLRPTKLNEMSCFSFINKVVKLFLIFSVHANDQNIPIDFGEEHVIFIKFM